VSSPIRSLLVDFLRALRALHEADPRRGDFDGLARFVVGDDAMYGRLREVFPRCEPDLSDAAIEQLADDWIDRHEKDCASLAEHYAKEDARDAAHDAEQEARVN